MRELQCPVCGKMRLVQRIRPERGNRCRSCSNSATKRSVGDPRRTWANVGGRIRPRLYLTWIAMRSRCLYQNDQAFHNYGGRGIYVCREWACSFEAFESWAYSFGFSEGLELDRRNNEGPYSPENCHWVTRTENGSNKRNNRILVIGGQRFTLSQAARKFGLNITTVHRRLKQGASDEMAVTPVLRPT